MPQQSDDAQEFLVERMAEAIWTSSLVYNASRFRGTAWMHLPDDLREYSRVEARAALAVVVGTPDEPCPNPECEDGTRLGMYAHRCEVCDGTTRVPGTAPARRPCGTCGGMGRQRRRRRPFSSNRPDLANALNDLADVLYGAPCPACQDGFSPIPAVLEALGGERIKGYFGAVVSSEPNALNVEADRTPQEFWRFPRQLGVQHEGEQT